MRCTKNWLETAFEIVIAPEAHKDFKGLDRAIQATVAKAMETLLRRQPTAVNKSRIKRLQGLQRPEYRLRIDDTRVFYDVNDEENRVEVLRILPKPGAITYLEQEGLPNEDTTTNES